MPLLRWTYVLLLTLAAPAPAAPQLTHANFPDGQSCCLVPDPQGNLYVIGTANANVSITKLDAAHRIVATFEFGGGSLDQPLAATLDPQGNLLIAGQTSSPDFPLLNPLIAQTAPGSPAGFLTRVNPATGQLLYSTRIGGLARETNFRLGTAINAVAVDSNGNIYAAGRTTAADFPVSPDAFQKTGALTSSFGPRPYGFVLKLSPAGDRLLYSTLLGGSAVNCDGGSHCIPKLAATNVNALAVDRNGIVTAAGTTNAPDFPTTPGAFQTVCRCKEYANNGFVTQLNAAGSAVRWSTFLGGSSYGFSSIPYGVNIISTLAQDSTGNIFVAGRTDANDFPTTPGALQPAFAGEVTMTQRTTDGFLAKLNPTGTALVFSTYLGGSAADQINDIQLDPQNTVWITGTNGSPGSFFAHVAADGSRLLANQPTPAGSTGQAIRLSNQLAILGPSGAVLRTPPGQLSGVSVFGIADSFSGPANAHITPGQFVSIYGAQLGPAEAVGARLDGDGRIASQLAGTQVLFNGIPAPLLYVSQGQLNALVPYGIGGPATVTVQVNSAAGNAPPATLHITAAQPSVLNNGPSALALNQDGAINTWQNPAVAGSFVTIFASGAGLLSRTFPDGSISPQQPESNFFSITRPVLPVSVLYDNSSLEVRYAGTAPGLVVNLLQINLRLPSQPGGVFRLMIGDGVSEPFAIAFQPPVSNDR